MSCAVPSALPDYEAALASALDVVAPVARDAERVALPDALGRVLAEPVRADRDLPPFDRAQMDGYAVRAADVRPGVRLPVAATAPAGAAAIDRVPAGACAKIATGAPVPADLDAVIPHEQSDRGDPVSFTVDSIEPGHAVHPRGADARAGAVLLTAGIALGPQHLGLAAAVGATTLALRPRPRAVVLTSGDEVVPPDAAGAPHQIRNSNQVQTAALLQRFGAEVVGTEHCLDERAPTIAAVRRALAAADLVITIGGVSAGERDHFPAAFDACGVTLALHGAAIQPGKPVAVGRTDGGAVVVALPGNPVSALATAHLFVRPIVRALLGLDPALPWRAVELAEAVKPNPRRRAFRPARLVDPSRAVVPRWAGSGDLAHTAATDGLVELPPAAEPVPAGATVRFLPWATAGA